MNLVIAQGIERKQEVKKRVNLEMEQSGGETKSGNCARRRDTNVPINSLKLMMMMEAT